jgi:hypothetical protein
MTISLAATAPASEFTATVTAKSGALVHALPVTVNGPAVAEIVLFGKDARTTGSWRIVDDVTAAYQKHVEQPDAGAAKIVTPLATPANYIELSFTAEPDVPYHLWIRAKAQKDSFNNDSVYVQCSGSLTDTGAITNRIGSPTAFTVTLEDCVNCGVAGWGWQDNGFGAAVLGPNTYFTGGAQTIRMVRQRLRRRRARTFTVLFGRSADDADSAA